MTKQEKTAVISICTNVVLTAAKFVLASVTASLALLAEAYHSFADVLSSTAVFAALRADRHAHSKTAAGRKSQEGDAETKPRFFSPGNWENKAGLAIGLVLAVAAINIFRKASQPTPIPIRYPFVAAVAVGLLALCSYFLYRFETSVGKETKSTALIADGRHAQTDMLASVLVMFALVASKTGVGFDRVAASIIGLFILSNAFYVLVQAGRSYAARIRGNEISGRVIYEDTLFLVFHRVFSHFDKVLWERLARLPGLKSSPHTARRRFGAGLVMIVVLVGAGVYGASGFYVIRPGEGAIVERFGRPLQKEEPVGPGLHYRAPWPVDRVRKVDVDAIRRLTIGYTTGERKNLILWTNIHYLSEYSVITGEGPFLDVAMNVHYKIGDPFRYLYKSAAPDAAVEMIGSQVLRETLGSEPFFPAMTSERNVLERVIRDEIQARLYEHELGILIGNVYFRDIHPPAQVAAAFEDVVSAQEDYETHIEEACGYQKESLPLARARAVTTVKEAEAYRNAMVAQSTGKATAFLLHEQAYRKAPALTQTRMLLETVEDSLSEVPKYIVGRNKTDRKPELWLSAPPLEQMLSGYSDSSRRRSMQQEQTQTKRRISSEEDLIEALLRFQQEQREEGK